MHTYRIFPALCAALLLTGCGAKTVTTSGSDIPAANTWSSSTYTVTYSDHWTDTTPEDTGGIIGLQLTDADTGGKVGIYNATTSDSTPLQMAEALLAEKNDNPDHNLVYTDKNAAEAEIFGYTAWYAEYCAEVDGASASKARLYYLQPMQNMIGVTLYVEDAADFDALLAALDSITLTVKE